MEKRQDIELVRILSAFGIVWFHSQISIGHEIAHSGLTIFLMLSIFLGNKNNDDIRISIFKRLNRFIIPWIIWFVIYGLVNYRKGSSIIFADNGVIAGILSGPSIHLWYLPFAFICLTSIDLIKKIFSDNIFALFGAIVSILLFASAFYWRQQSIDMGMPYEQYAHALPAIFLGIFFLNYSSLNKKIDMILILIISLSILFNINDESICMSYFVGLLVMLLVSKNPFPWIQKIKFEKISKFSFGIYLFHVLVLRFLSKHISHDDFMLPILSFVTSGLLVMLLSKVNLKLFKLIM